MLSKNVWIPRVVTFVLIVIGMSLSHIFMTSLNMDFSPVPEFGKGFLVLLLSAIFVCLYLGIIIMVSMICNDNIVCPKYIGIRLSLLLSAQIAIGAHAMSQQSESLLWVWLKDVVSASTLLYGLALVIGGLALLSFLSNKGKSSE